MKAPTLRSATPRSSTLLARVCATACIVSSLVVLLSVSPSAVAQLSGVTDSAARDSGSIEGSLRIAQTGKPAANVEVVIRETGDKALTDEKGHYTFPKVAPGTYTILATGPGYGRTRITDVVVRPGHELSLSRQSIQSKTAGTEPFEMEEYVVSARQEGVVEMDPYEVRDRRPEPFSDRNVDLPRTINDVQPYYIFNSQTIEESGAVTVEEFLRQKLTMNTTVQTNSQITPSSTRRTSASGLIASTASTINLRGLGANRTLILVNGLRMPGVSLFNGTLDSSTAGQPDLNGIPLSAIDRIEVLPSSAGAIYGVGAEGGVINVVLRKSYTGGELSIRYASAWDGAGESRTVTATLGRSFEDGKSQLFFTAEYSDAKPVYVGDRVDILERGYKKLLANNPDFINGYGRFGYGFLGTTANISSTGGRPLTLVSTGQSLGSSLTYIPEGTSPTTSAADLAAGLIQNAGKRNLTPPPTNQIPSGTLLPLSNTPVRKSAMMTITRQMTPNLQMHLDLSYTKNHSFSSFNSISVGGGGTTGAPYYVIGAGAPINPFNELVVVTFPFNIDSSYTSDSEVSTIAVGGTLKLPKAWTAHLDLQYSVSDYTFIEPNYFFDGSGGPVFKRAPTFGPTRVASGNTYVVVDNTNPTPTWAGAINPFVDTLKYPIDWSPFTYTYKGSGKNNVADLVLAAAGPVYHLPWGDPQLSIRADHVIDTAPAGAMTSYRPTATPFPGLPVGNWYSSHSYKQQQTTDSASVQLDLPIFKTRVPLLRSLEAQLNFGYQKTSVDAGSPGYITRDDNNYPWYTGSLDGPLGPLDANGKPYRYKTDITHTSFTGPALRYRPFEDVIIRGSIADGFVAPTYEQLLPSVAPLPWNPTVTDPKTNSSYPIVNYTGGNPNLKPQTGKSWDIGAVWEPSRGWFKGLRANLEYTKTEQHNLIYSPSLAFLVTNESNFPDLVIRDSTTGKIDTIYTRPVNLNLARNEALDISLDYNWSTSFGSFGLTAAESINRHVQQQINAGGPLLEYVGFPSGGGLAKTKATGTLRWAYRDLILAWTTVYTSSYNQNGAPGDPQYGGNPYGYGTESAPLYSTYMTDAQGSLTIPSQAYHNIFVSYTFRRPSLGHSRLGEMAGSLLDGVKISLTVNNVFNKVPPFDVYYNPFFTSPYGDIQLRNYSVTLRKSF